MTHQIPAERLIAFTPEQLWDNLNGEFTLLFEDKAVLTNHRETIYSAYAWEYHRRYPKTPVLSHHHIRHITKGGELPAQAHLKLLNFVYWDVYDTYVKEYDDPRTLLDELNRLVYEITNKIYNDLSVRLEPWVTSLDITDFIQITEQPALIKIVDEAKEMVQKLYNSPQNLTYKETRQGLAEKKIRSINELILNQLKEAPELRLNPLAVAIRTGISREGQALQCLGVRGFIEDVDSTVFPKPVIAGYISGMRSLYASVIESRSAAQALMNTTKPLQDSEYFSRRQQLVCMNIQNLHMYDCGSANYLLWHVKSDRDDGETRLKSDLNTIAGKFYLDEETNTLKVVRKSDTHLLGKTLKLRSLSAGCNCTDPNGVCYVCYGETGLALPKNSNLGHSACVTMTAILGQLILSTKHFLGSSTVDAVNLKSRPLESKYLSTEHGNSFYLNDKIKGKKIKFYINVDDAPGLPDLKLVSDVNQVNLERTSQFDRVQIGVDDGVNEDKIPLQVNVQHRLASLSPEMLAFLKLNPPTVVKEVRAHNYEIDMTGWDFSKPIFVLPMRHFNMSNHQGEIAKMLESTADEMEKRSKHVLATNMLIEFHDLVNRLISVNLSVLDAIIYSSMVVNTDEPNYDLPKPWTPSGLGVLRLLLSHRSLSAMMGYEDHRKTFTDPSCFVVKNRMNHPFDVLFCPDEVLKHHAKLQQPTRKRAGRNTSSF